MKKDGYGKEDCIRRKGYFRQFFKRKAGKATGKRAAAGIEKGFLFLERRRMSGPSGRVRQWKKYLGESAFREGRISIVFQDYTSSVNPRFQVFQIIGESLDVLSKQGGKHFSKGEKKEKILELLQLVGLREEHYNRFPHELSGGQLQRVCIARAIALEPKIILFDEAISSLDAHTQVQVMDLLKDLQEKFSFSYFFITHDLSSISYFCHRVLFLYQGEIVENLEVDKLHKVQHPYGKKLLHSIVELKEE